MAKFRFPGKALKLNTRKRVRYRGLFTATTPEEIYTRRIRQGLELFYKIFGESDEDEDDFEGFCTSEILKHIKLSKSITKRQKSLGQNLDSIVDESQSNASDGSNTQSTKLSRVKRKSVIDERQQQLEARLQDDTVEDEPVKKSQQQEAPISENKKDIPTEETLLYKRAPRGKEIDGSSGFKTKKTTIQNVSRPPTVKTALAKKLLAKAKKKVPSVPVQVEKSPKKFILPSMSARSSRIITPNKRLFADITEMCSTSTPLEDPSSSSQEILSNKRSVKLTQKGRGSHTSFLSRPRSLSQPETEPSMKIEEKDRMQETISLYTESITCQTKKGQVGRPPKKLLRRHDLCLADDDNDFEEISVDEKESKVKEKIEKLLRSPWDDRIKQAHGKTSRELEEIPGSVGPSMNHSSAMSKGIIREARLNLNKRTLQKIRNPVSLQRLIPSSDEGVVDGKCAFCDLSDAELSRKFSVICCDICSNFISNNSRGATDVFNCIKSQLNDPKLSPGKSGEAKLSPKKVSSCTIIGTVSEDRCSACWLACILNKCTMPNLLHDRLRKRLPLHLKENIPTSLARSVSNSSSGSPEKETDDQSPHKGSLQARPMTDSGSHSVFGSLVDLPGGWRRRTQHSQVIVISPCGEKFRTIPKLEEFLKKRGINIEAKFLFGNAMTPTVNPENSSPSITAQHSHTDNSFGQKNKVVMTTLPGGWIRRIKWRPCGDRFDTYVFSPDGRTFRSKRELSNYFVQIGKVDDIHKYFPVTTGNSSSNLSSSEQTDSSGTEPVQGSSSELQSSSELGSEISADEKVEGVTDNELDSTALSDKSLTPSGSKLSPCKQTKEERKRALRMLKLPNEDLSIDIDNAAVVQHDYPKNEFKNKRRYRSLPSSRKLCDETGMTDTTESESEKVRTSTPLKAFRAKNRSKFKLDSKLGNNESTTQKCNLKNFKDDMNEITPGETEENDDESVRSTTVQTKNHGKIVLKIRRQSQDKKTSSVQDQIIFQKEKIRPIKVNSLEPDEFVNDSSQENSDGKIATGNLKSELMISGELVCNSSREKITTSDTGSGDGYERDNTKNDSSAEENEMGSSNLDLENDSLSDFVSVAKESLDVSSEIEEGTLSDRFDQMHQNVHDEGSLPHQTDTSNILTNKAESPKLNLQIPISSSKPSPVSPKPSPISPKPSPVSIKPSPVSPKTSPISPKPCPITPKPSPVSLKPSPASPKPSPASPRLKSMRSRFQSISPKFKEPKAIKDTATTTDDSKVSSPVVSESNNARESKPKGKVTTGKNMGFLTQRFGNGWTRKIKWNENGTGKIARLLSPDGQTFRSRIELMAYFKKAGRSKVDIDFYFPPLILRDEVESSESGIEMAVTNSLKEKLIPAEEIKPDIDRSEGSEISESDKPSEDPNLSTDEYERTPNKRLRTRSGPSIIKISTKKELTQDDNDTSTIEKENVQDQLSDLGDGANKSIEGPKKRGRPPKNAASPSLSSVETSAGPRVKHVCRSQAQVLGIPRAIFPSPTKGGSPTGYMTINVPSGKGKKRKKMVITTTASGKVLRKTQWCGKCIGCTTPNCRKCVNCLDMKKYGGPGTKKKPCLQRKCQNPRLSMQSAIKAETGSSKSADVSMEQVEDLVSERLAAASLQQETMSSVPLKKNHQQQEEQQPVLGTRRRHYHHQQQSQPNLHQTVTSEVAIQHRKPGKLQRQLAALKNQEKNVFVPLQPARPQPDEQKDAKKDIASGKELIPGAMINIDYWQEYDADDMMIKGFPIISSTPLSLEVLCFRCGSAGKDQLLFCVWCCEGIHPYCLEDGEGPETEVEEMWWCCRRCATCHVCGFPGLDDNLLRCSDCRYYYHMECLGPAAHTNCQPQSDRPWEAESMALLQHSWPAHDPIYEPTIQQENISPLETVYENRDPQGSTSANDTIHTSNIGDISIIQEHLNKDDFVKMYTQLDTLDDQDENKDAGDPQIYSLVTTTPGGGMVNEVAIDFEGFLPDGEPLHTQPDENIQLDDMCEEDIIEIYPNAELETPAGFKLASNRLKNDFVSMREDEYLYLGYKHEREYLSKNIEISTYRLLQIVHNELFETHGYPTWNELLSKRLVPEAPLYPSDSETDSAPESDDDEAYENIDWFSLIEVRRNEALEELRERVEMKSNKEVRQKEIQKEKRRLEKQKKKEEIELLEKLKEDEIKKKESDKKIAQKVNSKFKPLKVKNMKISDRKLKVKKAIKFLCKNCKKKKKKVCHCRIENVKKKHQANNKQNNSNKKTKTKKIIKPKEKRKKKTIEKRKLSGSKKLLNKTKPIKRKRDSELDNENSANVRKKAKLSSDIQSPKNSSMKQTSKIKRSPKKSRAINNVVPRVMLTRLRSPIIAKHCRREELGTNLNSGEEKNTEENDEKETSKIAKSLFNESDQVLPVINGESDLVNGESSLSESDSKTVVCTKGFAEKFKGPGDGHETLNKIVSGSINTETDGSKILKKSLKQKTITSFFITSANKKESDNDDNRNECEKATFRRKTRTSDANTLVGKQSKLSNGMSFDKASLIKNKK